MATDTEEIDEVDVEEAQDELSELRGSDFAHAFFETNEAEVEATIRSIEHFSGSQLYALMRDEQSSPLGVAAFILLERRK